MTSLAILGSAASGQEEASVPADPASSAEVVDRIVAVVDEDPILASDIDRVIGLGLAARLAGEPEQAFRRRVLDLLVEERLRAHEVDRFGFTEISLTEVESAIEELRSGFEGDSFDRRLGELGLDLDDVRQIVARQIMVITYVDERLGPRVFVSLDDIQAYYDTVLAAEMKRTGQELPPIAEVREQIRRLLREERLNQEIDRWTRELRLEADIEDYFEPAAEGAGDVSLGSRSEPGPGA